MNLGPKAFIELIKQQPASVLPALGPMKLLLVELDDQAKELGAFFDLMWQEDAALLGAEKDIGTPEPPSVTRVGPAPFRTKKKRSGPIEELTPKALLKILNNGSYAAIVVNKRGQGAESLGAPKVSVGRVRNSDLVLLHPSVSNKHALLDCDAEGVYFVRDVGSTNGTKVNGKRIAPDEAVDIYPGDEISFGHVDTTLCTFEILWRALAGDV